MLRLRRLFRSKEKPGKPLKIESPAGKPVPKAEKKEVFSYDRSDKFIVKAAMPGAGYKYVTTLSAPCSDATVKQYVDDWAQRNRKTGRIRVIVFYDMPAGQAPIKRKFEHTLPALQPQVAGDQAFQFQILTALSEMQREIQEIREEQGKPSGFQTSSIAPFLKMWGPILLPEIKAGIGALLKQRTPANSISEMMPVFEMGMRLGEQQGIMKTMIEQYSGDSDDDSGGAGSIADLISLVTGKGGNGLSGIAKMIQMYMKSQQKDGDAGEGEKDGDAGEGEEEESEKEATGEDGDQIGETPQ